ncbi:C6 transcription factor [Apiospora aurea]|uniref:C6 transcription factor n=1 Tax=Apiospora aurea TaxID=335848 RepID=A0ABR1QH38_9PEZI
MMDGSEFTKPDKRRRRPALACVACRRSKVRCDRNMPCGACVRSKHKTCVYEPAPTKASSRNSAVAAAAAAAAVASGPTGPGPGPGPGLCPLLGPEVDVESRFPISPAASSQAPSTVDTSTASFDEHVASSHSIEAAATGEEVSTSNRVVSQAAAAHDVDSLLQRVKELERQLEAARISPQANAHFNAPKIPNAADASVTTYPTYLTDDIHTMNKSVMSKTRYFGQSHWMNIVTFLKPVMDIFDNQAMEVKSEIVMLLHQNKLLARTIKAQRMPELTFKFGLKIPPREIADQLVNGYLRTFETVYRVLHVPSFKAEYEKYWASPESVSQAFVIQMQLVMAAGAGVYDDVHSMRKAAIAWVYEAQCWLMTPPLKSKLTITGLQNMLLLHLAREVAGVSGDLTWISISSVIRSAIAMGLHRDPKRLPNMSRADAEIRRRLWNTTLELALQSSMNAGGPPMISLDEFDTGPPSDCDDAELDTSGVDRNHQPPSAPANTNRFTDTTVTLALRKSFPLRLAIVRHLNDINSMGKYDDTLKLNAQLQTAYKAASLSLRRFDGGGGRQPSTFQKQIVNFIFHHYFQSHHLPYLRRAFREPAYAFSRKMVVEMSLNLFSAVSESSSYGYSVGNNSSVSHRPSPHGTVIPGTATGTPSSTTAHHHHHHHDDLNRLATNSSGFFRNATTKASMLIPVELQYQALENDGGLGLLTPRPDLLAAVRDTAAWAMRRIRAGETNTKGYIMCRAMVTYVEGLAAGAEVRDLYGPCIEAAAAAAGREVGGVLRGLAGFGAEEGGQGAVVRWISKGEASLIWRGWRLIGIWICRGMGIDLTSASSAERAV